MYLLMQTYCPPVGSGTGGPEKLVNRARTAQAPGNFTIFVSLIVPFKTRRNESKTSGVPGAPTKTIQNG